MGALGDSFYEYLLKMWLLTDKKIPKYSTTLETRNVTFNTLVMTERMYLEAEKGVIDHMVTMTDDKQLLYIAELGDAISLAKRNMMDHLVCFAGTSSSLLYPSVYDLQLLL